MLESTTIKSNIVPYGLSLILAVVSILLSGCETFQAPPQIQENPQLSWLEYDSKGAAEPGARIKALKKEIRNCPSKANCADLNYQIAILYLGRKPLSLKKLNRASNYLKKATGDGQYKQHARVLNKVLLGWIEEDNKNQKLIISLKRAKEIDFEKKIKQ